MEQQQVAIGESNPKMDFSEMSALSLTDHLDEVLDRAKAFAEIVESNALDGTTAFETLGHNAIAKLAWQIWVNLEFAKEINSAMWERYKQATANCQLKG